VSYALYLAVYQDANHSSRSETLVTMTKPRHRGLNVLPFRQPAR